MKNSEVLIRLRRAEGQVRGMQKMVENDRYWLDIADQMRAVQSATKNVAIILLENHIRESIIDAIENRNIEGKTQEIITVVKQFVK